MNGAPKPTPRKKSAVKSPPSNAKESLDSETTDGMDQKSNQPFLSIIDQLRKSDQRIDEIEFVVNKMGAYVEESLTNLTEAIKDSTDKMMRSFDKPSDDTRTEQVPLVYGSKFTVAKRRLNFLEKNAKGVSNELEKLMNAGAATHFIGNVSSVARRRYKFITTSFYKRVTYDVSLKTIRIISDIFLSQIHFSF